VPADVKRTNAAVLASIAAAAILPYAATAGDYFIQDDFGVVGLLSQKPWWYFPRWFVGTWMDDIWGYTPDEVRPFPAATYQIAAIWGAASPWANHLINIGFHAVNAWLVYGIARAAAGLGVAASAAAAVLFAVLPMQAESVAWVTGRVDSMPACFYLAAFLLFVYWRDRGSRVAYAGAVACCFVALFSKQNAITLPAALVAYDVLFARDRPRPLLAAASAHVPFVVLTLGYLWLRWVIFGEVAREGALTAERLAPAIANLGLHLRRMVFGEPGVSMPNGEALLLALVPLVLAALLAVRYGQRQSPRRLLPAAFYFLIVWVGLGLAPTLVAGYASPRHMYLASVGWTIGLAVLADALWSARFAWLRWAATGAVAALLAVYVVQLQGLVRQWHVRAVVSQRAVADLEREVLAAPAGSLILINVPRASWEYAVPHSLRPPFTSTDLTARAAVVTQSFLSCCPAEQWDRQTRTSVREWLARSERPPLIALHWDPATGAMTRVTDAEESSLAVIAQILPDTGNRGALDEAIADTFTQLVIPRAGRSGR
jgi:hypothetical protein